MTEGFDVIDAELEEHRNPVARVYEDGSIEGFDEGMAVEDIEMVLGPNREALYRRSETVENEEGDEEIQSQEDMVEPGADGYLAVVIESLPYPYKADFDTVTEQMARPPAYYE